MITEDTMKQIIRDIPDFPMDGVMFRDITPVLQNPRAFNEVICSMVDCVKGMKPDVVVGIESRGFILGAPIALELGLGFVPVRKKGKLPYETVQAEYELEYGTNAVEIHKDAVDLGMRVAIVDDLLATGGTAKASVQLVEELGGVVAGLSFIIELTFLNGRNPINDYEVCTLVKY